MPSLYDNTPVEVTPFAATLRPYQQQAVDAIYEWFGNHSGNPLVVLPTGSGKSMVQAAFIHSVWDQFPGERILCVTHVRELIAQNHAALMRCWTTAPAGIYSAGIGRREADAPILFCGIQSTHKKAARIGWCDLLIVDESHLIPTKGFGMYRSFIEDLRSVNPEMKVIGLTATPFRTDTGSLHEGKDRLFHGIAYTAEIPDLIEQGYLSPVTAKGTGAEISTQGIGKQGGEFVAKQLEARAVEGDNVPKAVAEIVARGADRSAWLVFCCGIEHADRVLAELRGHGVDCEAVYGSTKKADRDAIIERYKARELRALVSVGVLTTGFDAPHVDLIALLRPTASPGLFVQMVGRGLRIAEGKRDCLVLDFGGNVMRHGPIDDVRVREPGKKGEAGATELAKRCPQCSELVALPVMQCACGYEWPERETPTHDETPAELPILGASRPAIEKWTGVQTVYSHHHKEGKPHPVLRVEYMCGFQQRANEWICFEHVGFAQRKAHSWWRQRGGKEPFPATVHEALVRIQDLHEIRDPYEVVVDTRREYPEIKGVRFREPGEDEDEPVSSPTSTINADDLPF